MGTVKRRAEDLGAWAQSLRFSGFTVLIVALVAAGGIILSPSLSTYVQQRREIAELRESVEQRREAVEEIDAERAKWRDPAYVRAQARDRLFYVMPGEIQLNVIDDITMPLESTDVPNSELEPLGESWASALTASLLGAGLADAPPESVASETESN